jgi:hypothetical protein
MTRNQQHSGERHRESRFRVKCPHCGKFARGRSSDVLTPTYREVRFECTNDDCGHVWVSGLEVLRTLCPSDTPNPDIQIPLAAAIRTAINDTTTPIAAVG